MTNTPRISITTVRFNRESRQGFVFPRHWGKVLAAVGVLIVVTMVCAGMLWSYIKSGRLPEWYEVHDWKGLLLGVFGTLLCAVFTGYVAWSIFRPEGQVVLLPEGILRPTPRAPVLFPWQAIIAVTMEEIPTAGRQGYVLYLHLRDDVPMSTLARLWIGDMTQPSRFSIAASSYTLPPQIVDLVIRYYAEGRGDTTAIGTEEELARLHAALGLDA